MYYIYVIQNLSDEKVYIGQSVDTRNRFSQHRCSLRADRHPNCHMQSGFNEVGDMNFSFFVLSNYETPEEVDEAEQFYINWYRNIYVDDYTSVNMCYNFESGGNKGKKHSPESIEKIKAARARQEIDLEAIRRGAEKRKGKPSTRKNWFMTPEHKEKLMSGKHNYYEKFGHPSKGKPMKDHVKEAIRKSTVGRIHSLEEKEKRRNSCIGKDYGGQRYQAFGESKTISQWSRDERCVVERGTLKTRIKNGWDIEKAITLVPEKKVV